MKRKGVNSLTKKSLLLLLVMTLFSLGLSLSLEIWFSKKLFCQIKIKEKRRIEQAFPTLIQLHENRIGNMLNSFGMWDEMYENVKKKNTKWLREMFEDDEMVTTQFEIYGVYNEKGEAVYVNQPFFNKNEVKQIITYLRKNFRKGDMAKPLTFFLWKEKENLYHVGILPLSDSYGYIKSFGFIYFGTLFSKKEIKEAEKLLSVKMKVFSTRHQLKKDKTEITTMPLKNLFGETVALLKVYEGNILTSFFHNIKHTLIIIAIILITSYTIIFLIISRKFSNTVREILKEIAISLEELSKGNFNALKNLEKISSRKDELGILTENIKNVGEQLSKNLLTDPLTGSYNRLYFIKKLEEDIERAKREKTPLAFAIIDLDDFKNINDTYGHKTGDLVLKEFVKTAKNCIRKIDTLARVGGEEFALIFPSANIDAARKIVDRIRKNLKPIKTEDNRHISLTFSCGITSFKKNDNVDTIYHRADIALYRAKEKGKNRTEVEE
ncbi:diguanylate cyclase domain-containing protein [Desulfurobacterium atlanticum]|uniref:diguanylate cyclase n=1 Tax=Desulfurobacterium atlanticum TaxID=240169 RepID=A0A238ZRQ5_9BACT|nr:diguanylate cyclase [Desulfurobacterium atlanticum]SNR86020.1 diguanylate cyclase (GGDEF) domain-containing protein [Desulfurobacterium atlanticum]